MALRKNSLGPTGLHTDRDVAKAWEIEISCDFVVLGKVIRNKGRFLVVVPSKGNRGVVHQSVGNVLSMDIWR
jgi:hypothetical protein